MTADPDVADFEPAGPRAVGAPVGGAGRAVAGARRDTIAIFGLFGCGNLGNDASLEAMLELLRAARPEARLLCFCDRPDVVAERFELATLPICGARQLYGLPRRLDRTLRKIGGRLMDVVAAFRQIRRADVMIVPGTGILDDFGERPYGMPFDLFRWCLAARLTGTRIALVSIGAGPIRHPLSRRLMKAAARLAHYRSYRDEQSRAFMESIGFDTSGDHIYPDIVFRLEEPPPCPPREPGGRPVVGVGVMSYCGWYGFAAGGDAIFERYTDKIGRFVVHLLDTGHDVRLLTGEHGDQTAVDRVRQGVAAARPGLPPGRLVSEPIASLHDLMRQMAETDAVVATRFHNIVCALKLGKPTISLGYARKNDVLMAEMGLGDYCHHVEEFDVDTLIAQFSELMSARGRYQRGILARGAEFKDQLRRQDAYLLEHIL